MRKLSTAETLAAQIQDGATIAISGKGGGATPPLKRAFCKPDTRAI